VTRAALLPAGADPFLNAYWLRHYRLWADEVDELRVLVCGQTDPQIIRYLETLASGLPHVVIDHVPRRDHGKAIRELVEATNADHVLLLEDDAFIRKPGVVNAAFERIERGETDIVGCPRTSAVPDLVSAVEHKFGTLVAETDEQGPHLWPCFLFARRADLLATDRNFGAAAWRPGETVPGLDWGPSESDVAGDTFVWASIQLRTRGLRVHVEPEYRADKAKMPSWDDIPWFHVGSLSSGYGYIFLAGMSEVDRHNHAASIDSLHDWNKRMSWWQRVHQQWDGILVDEHEAYAAGLYEMFSDLRMSQGPVDEWRHLFDRFTTWE
jgi:hypothetical protein